MREYCDSAVLNPVENMIELWALALRSIEASLGGDQWELWLRPIECVSVGEGRIRLKAPNRYHQEWFADNYLPTILQDMEARAQQRFAVEFELDDPEPPVSSTQARAPAAARAAETGGSPPASLNSRYTFEAFVVGPNNHFTHGAARRVASEPGSMNPLFIHGGVGLGKTHLLHAVGWEIWRRHPDWRIVCLSSEQFVIEFIGAMTGGRRGGSVALMERFRARYREEPDVLLIDDVQFLSNKDSSQDEFFHTFNALHLAHKQIVLTCDKLPSELPGLEERIRSRFAWGVTTTIDIPDLETRAAILKRKALQERFVLPDDVAQIIARHVTSNVRELEGALLRLIARASIEGRVVTPALAEDTVRSLLASAPASLTIETILREVAGYYGVRLHDLKGPKRHRAVSRPRMVAMYLARRLTGTSFPEIGSRVGGKDHSTVISAVKKIEHLLATDAALRDEVAALESLLQRRH